MPPRPTTSSGIYSLHSRPRRSLLRTLIAVSTSHAFVFALSHPYLYASITGASLSLSRIKHCVSLPLCIHLTPAACTTLRRRRLASHIESNVLHKMPSG
ncbi:hypothetical protein EXIGLDRAFT_428864 [Exidia glandulosa HHB12029]|uniref:Uncharacterized protein n=1 Tax=Exidia glandulosa HHB12029 TaxID=1314781 RepID=A0A165KJG2_EXIGL|nr:hypothetical protein EXIGLDRAFT_428864 [Exidia glandulosa HHB12029]